MAKKSEQQNQAAAQTDVKTQETVTTDETRTQAPKSEARSPKPDSVECEVAIGSINEDGKNYVLGQRIRLPQERAETRAKAGTVRILKAEARDD